MIAALIRYWQQMINCRNAKCRYGCKANPAIQPHGPYYYGDVVLKNKRVRRVYIGKDVDEWLDEQNAARDDDDQLELPNPNAGAPCNRAPKNKSKPPRSTGPKAPAAPRLTPGQIRAQAFLNSRPTAKDALRWFGLAAADRTELKRAYKAQALTAHPDKGGSTVEMQAVNAAKALVERWLK